MKPAATQRQSKLRITIGKNDAGTVNGHDPRRNQAIQFIQAELIREERTPAVMSQAHTSSFDSKLVRYAQRKMTSELRNCRLRAEGMARRIRGEVLEDPHPTQTAQMLCIHDKHRNSLLWVGESSAKDAQPQCKLQARCSASQSEPQRALLGRSVPITLVVLICELLRRLSDVRPTPDSDSPELLRF